MSQTMQTNDAMLRVGDVAAALGVNPTVLSRAIYTGVVPREIIDQCPVVGGRRQIPRALLGRILDALMQRGWVRSRVPTIN